MKLLITPLLFAVLLAPHALISEITADFDDGNTSEEIDGVPGMAGGGWEGAWGKSGDGNAPSHVFEADDTAPLLPGLGNYLTSSYENAVTETKRRIVERTWDDFDGVSTTAEHTVSFLFRADTTLELIYLSDFDPAVGNGFVTSSTATWFASVAPGGSWQFANANGISGGQTVSDGASSGVDLIIGDVYAFELLMDPANNRYLPSVTNLDFDGELDPGVGSWISGDWLPFQVSEDTVYGNLGFGMRIAGEETATFSVDSVAIVPEPAAVAWVAGCLGLALVVWRRRS